ncbi:MAG: ZIP family metal transporter [Candidatus Uhrbacteria bacterium]
MMTILFGLIAGAATLIGMWLILAREAWARRNSVYLIIFSAGILLSAALYDIIPEALELHPYALLFVLATFFVFYLLEHSVVAHCHADPEHCELRAPIEKLAFIGLTVHSLIDGLVIGAGFAVSPTLGIIATLAVILHEIPEGVTSITLFLHAGYARKKAVLWTTIVALATPFGAIVIACVPTLLTDTTLGILLAVAGGSFIYVAASNLIPETRSAKHIPAIILMAIGMLVPLLLHHFLPHEHSDQHAHAPTAEHVAGESME